MSGFDFPPAKVMSAADLQSERVFRRATRPAPIEPEQTAAVVRLPRQCRRGIVVDSRSGVMRSGEPYSFTAYEWQLGRGPIGDVYGTTNRDEAFHWAYVRTKVRGLPLLDRTAS